MVSVRPCVTTRKKLASHGMSRTKLTSQLWGETWELGEAAKPPVVNANSILRGGEAVVDGWYGFKVIKVAHSMFYGKRQIVPINLCRDGRTSSVFFLVRKRKYNRVMQ